jgi:RNA polymerase sigma factor (sigma-70 family)
MKKPKPMNQELEAYLPLVHAAAWRLRRLHNLPSHVHEDLLQEGFLGLLDAHTRYESTHGASFGTFARSRVMGAMVDYLHREGRGDSNNQYFAHEHVMEPVERAVAARESLSLISAAVSNLTYRRRKIMEAVVNFESLEDAAEDVAVGYRKARRWRLEGLEEIAGMLEVA